jgi:hypothetical protein
MDKPRYWFPAKTYGWGWGIPSTWEGWVVMALFMAVMLAGGIYLLPRYGEGPFLAFTFVCCMALLAEGWPLDDPDGGEVIDLSAYRRAA